MSDDILELFSDEQIDRANELLDVVAHQVERNMDDDEFIAEDGLLHCKRCGDPRQIKLEVMGKIRTFPTPCSCMADKFREEEENERAEEKRRKVEQLKAQGLTDAFYLRSTFSGDTDLDNPTRLVAERYVNNFEEMLETNTGLLLRGNCGVGKTFYAACIANALLEKGYSVLMTSLPKLMGNMSANYGEKKATILHQIENIDLLIIDDYGVERSTETAFEQAFEIIDTRYRAGKPIILTTNLTVEALNSKDRKQARISDRLSEMCVLVEVEGKSQRRRVAEEKKRQARNLLGI